MLAVAQRLIKAPAGGGPRVWQYSHGTCGARARPSSAAPRGDGVPGEQPGAALRR